MKKIWLIAALLVTLSASAEPLLHWDFRNAKADKDGVHFVSTGTRKGVVSATGQVPDTAFLICGPDIAPRAYFGKLSAPSAAIEISFKLNKAPSRKMTLFSYEESSWGRAWLGLYITEDSRIGTFVNRIGRDTKSFRMETKPVFFSPGVEHTIRVTLVSGGMGRICLDGKQLKEESGALCFSDFTDPPGDKYHPFATVGYSYWNCNTGETFDGVITDLSVSETAQETDNASNADDSQSRTDVNLLTKETASAPRIDGDLEESCWHEAEWTEPFLVLGAMSKTVNGLWESADPTFVKAASRAALLCDGQNLYAAIRSPFPAGMKPKAEKKTGESIWEDDCLEFFLYPPEADFYYQLLINAGGAWQGLKHSLSGGKIDAWKPEGLQVAAKLAEHHFDIELSLPFSSLGEKSPASGALWTGNFAREGKTCGGLSSWAPVGTSFLAPDRFGKFVFGSRKTYFFNQLHALDSEMAKMEADLPAAVREARTRLTQALEKDGEDRGNWLSLHNQIRSLENQLIQAVNKGKTHLVWQDDPWSNFGPDRKIPFETKELDVLNLKTAKGARAIASFFVSNLTGRALMTNIMFQTDPKKKNDPDVKKFAEKVRFREVAYIELNGGKMIPDPIFDLPIGSMLRVAPDTTSVVWLDIDTADLKPGKYTGTIRLYPSFSGFEQKEIKVNLQVSPVDISKVFVRNWTYGVRSLDQFGSLKEYGFNTINPIPWHYYPVFDKDGKAEFPRLEAMIRGMEENGVSKDRLFILFYPEFRLWGNIRTDDGRWVKFLEPEWKKIMTHRYSLLRDWLKEQGFGYDQYAFYTSDEPNGDPDDPKSYAYIAFEGGKFLKGIDPEFRLFTNPYKLTDGRQKKYFELFEILTPNYPQMAGNRALIEEYRTSGREIWTYAVLEKSVQPLRYRRLFWENLDAGFEGPATFYDLFAMNGDGFNSYDSNPGSRSSSDYGAAYLNVRCSKLAPSRRLEAWYLGLVDFKTAKFCREKIAERKKAGMNTEAEEKELAEIIQEGFRSGGSMELAGKRLLALGERLLNQ